MSVLIFNSTGLDGETPLPATAFPKIFIASENGTLTSAKLVAKLCSNKKYRLNITNNVINLNSNKLSLLYIERKKKDLILYKMNHFYRKSHAFAESNPTPEIPEIALPGNNAHFRVVTRAFRIIRVQTRGRVTYFRDTTQTPLTYIIHLRRDY